MDTFYATTFPDPTDQRYQIVSPPDTLYIPFEFTATPLCDYSYTYSFTVNSSAPPSWMTMDQANKRIIIATDDADHTGIYSVAVQAYIDSSPVRYYTINEDNPALEFTLTTSTDACVMALTTQ